MNAFHTLWTGPFYSSRHHDAKYSLEDFDILTTIISALKWRSTNGSIKLYTDDAGAEYIDSLGIANLWDLGIDTTAIKTLKHEIDPGIFWAAGKLMALYSQPAPCVMMDTDFIVWESILDRLGGNLSVIHRESRHETVYIGQQYLNTPDRYSFDPEWSWDVDPCNTAFVYFPDNEFKNGYASSALEFMRNNPPQGTTLICDPLPLMVFAEQRIIAMCAHKQGVEITTLMPEAWADWTKQNTYTHMWAHKQELRESPASRTHFCKCCIGLILKEFPEWEDALIRIGDLSEVFENIRTGI